MKKKGILCICSGVLLIALAAGSIYYRNMPVVSINMNVKNGEEVANSCGFSVQTGEEVAVSYSSKVEEGDLVIRLTDENRNTIKEFQSGEQGKEPVYLEKGNYYMRVESDYFKGSYHVKVLD